MNIIKQIIWGFAFGVANIIPGVSGGTFALVLGFYERLLAAIEGVNSRAVIDFVKIIKSFGKDSDQALRDLISWCKAKDILFLVLLGLGAIISILGLSSLMKYLLVAQFAPTYGFFFGLILLSVVVPWNLIKQKSIVAVVCVVVGAAATIGVTVGVDPVAKAEAKSINYQSRVESSESTGKDLAQTTVKPEKFTWTDKYTTGELVMAGVSGAIAISAMVLPGISGSLILILLGQYMLVIQAVSNLKRFVLDDFVFLSIMAIGMGLGLVLTARLVKWALANIHDQTMGFLTGLIIGSLYVLWPFREVVERDLYVKQDGEIVFQKGVQIYTNQLQIPDMTSASMVVFGMIALGIGLMVFFIKNDPEAA